MFKRIPTKYADFAARKKREACYIGVAALLFGTLSTCVIAITRGLRLNEALLACARWQGMSTVLALTAIAQQYRRA